MMQQSSIVLLLLYCLDFRILKEFVVFEENIYKIGYIGLFHPNICQKNSLKSFLNTKSQKI